MEIEAEANNGNYTNTKSGVGIKLNNNNFYSNENTPFNLFNNYKFINQNLINQSIFFKNNNIRKRTYNESLSPKERIKIKEKEAKFLYNIFHQLKLKLDTNNSHNLKFSHFQNNIEKKYKEKEDENDEDKDIEASNDNHNIKDPIYIDYSIIDLNDVIMQLFQSDKISNELKNFLFKKLINNAIEIEKTFNTYFNFNYYPNKK